MTWGNNVCQDESRWSWTCGRKPPSANVSLCPCISVSLCPLCLPLSCLRHHLQFNHQCQSKHRYPSQICFVNHGCNCFPNWYLKQYSIKVAFGTVGLIANGQQHDTIIWIKTMTDINNITWVNTITQVNNITRNNCIYMVFHIWSFCWTHREGYYYLIRIPLNLFRCLNLFFWLTFYDTYDARLSLWCLGWEFVVAGL